ncbi:conserved hypothetical protein [Paraburkholderia piptadeniae]|uniref:Uncharacterized protein n=1 Tax=Paraburkholderia piptadeniae TaxID=1701573 RepID=A0A1N7RQ15_9BURK|nr:hypothetical protein [Paraburkholderia piptadeniae]SIT37183.1 conserved hypothetical protein [Paraburkholderia piptadeniae]
MSTRSYTSYRGCNIEVQVTPAKSRALGGVYRRFRVSWTVSLPDDPNQKVASFPEQFDFLTDQEAFRYGEKRAHTFIDCMLSTPSMKGMASDDSQQGDQASSV